VSRFSCSLLALIFLHFSDLEGAQKMYSHRARNSWLRLCQLLFDFPLCHRHQKTLITAVKVITHQSSQKGVVFEFHALPDKRSSLSVTILLHMIALRTLLAKNTPCTALQHDWGVYKRWRKGSLGEKCMLISRFDMSCTQAHWVGSNQSPELCH